MPCTGEPVMLRTVSPQPPAVVMPAASRCAKTSGRLSKAKWWS